MTKENDLLFPKTSNSLKRVTSSVIADVLNDSAANVNKKLLAIRNNDKLYEEAVRRSYYHKNGKKDCDTRSFGGKCYRNKLKAKAKDYVDLDNYYRKEYPQQFQSNGYIDTQTLCNVIEMKFQRGVKRPLAKKIMGNDDQTVKKCSEAALKILSNQKASNEKYILEAIKEFSELVGIGPASAIFLLSPFSFASQSKNALDIPIMSDECLEVLGYARNYTITEYVSFRNDLIDLANQLNKDTNKNSGDRSDGGGGGGGATC